ncbi:MAG: hypothetical protein AAF138_03070 [Planctomycetota bacterium]
MTSLIPTPWTLAAAPDALIPDGVGREIADAVPRLIEAWPIETIAIPAVVLVAGLALWLAGAKLIRPVFAVLGLALGAGAGYLIVPQFGWETIFGVSSPLIGLAAGGLIGLIGAFMLYRLAMGLSGGAALALVAALAAGAYLRANPTPDPGGDLSSELAESRPAQELLFDGVPLDNQFLDSDQINEIGEGIREHLDGKRPENAFEEARAVLDQFALWAKDLWNDLPTRDRFVLLTAAIGAFTIGLAFGLAAPKKAAAIVSAPFGASVWLSAGLWLLWVFKFNLAERVGANPALSLVTLGVISAIGIFIQLGGRGKKKRDRDDDRNRDDDEEDDD